MTRTIPLMPTGRRVDIHIETEIRDVQNQLDDQQGTNTNIQARRQKLVEDMQILQDELDSQRGQKKILCAMKRSEVGIIAYKLHRNESEQHRAHFSFGSPVCLCSTEEDVQGEAA